MDDLIRRYKYTIALTLVILLSLFGWYHILTGKERCDEHGGIYAWTLTGYECIPGRNNGA